MSEALSLNLYQRLAAISRDVGQIKATGRTAQGTKTLSISDVEDALRDLLAKHGVVTGFRWEAAPSVVAQEGRMTLWLADLTVWLLNADNPSEMREDRVYDIGSSPSGAVSFALKRYYRALFHLADEEDETRSAPVPQRPATAPAAPAPRPAPATPPAPAPRPPQDPGTFVQPAPLAKTADNANPDGTAQEKLPEPSTNSASATEPASPPAEDPAFQQTEGPCADCGGEMAKTMQSYITNNRKKGASLRWSHRSVPGGEKGQLCKKAAA